MTVTPSNPLFVAVDTADLHQATRLAAALADVVGGLKLGLEFFTAHGIKGVRHISKATGDLPIFLDLKFHDIPNTVAGAIRAACACRPAIVNVHAIGGRAMMEAAAKAARDGAAEHKVARPLVIAVTVLTSMDADDLGEVGVSRAVSDQVVELAKLAKDCGLDGVVCSAHEAMAIRQACGAGFKLIVPGVRPDWAGSDDQKRIMTPAQAIDEGADILVVGRPVTGAASPCDAAKRVLRDLPREGDRC